ncbi:hypothetical protein PAXRUDRAFT_834674, partial [Paxillus rubicundulus Ve08.2h10]
MSESTIATASNAHIDSIKTITIILSMRLGPLILLNDVMLSVLGHRPKPGLSHTLTTLITTPRFRSTNSMQTRHHCIQ